MRYIFFLFAFIPFSAHAVEAPAGQVRIDQSQVLRGNFVHELKTATARQPWQTSGHFVIAPAHGLIWSVDKPILTATVVTPDQAVQQIAGVNVKLPIKNLRSLYDVICSALAGDWNKLDKDFTIKQQTNGKQWVVILTPRAEQQKLPYQRIDVSGSPHVERILLTKADGGYDAVTFSNEVLSSAPLTDTERAIFNKIKL